MLNSDGGPGNSPPVASPFGSGFRICASGTPRPMPLLPVTSLSDPRIALYRNLKDRDLDRSGRWFIAEGEYVVRRLLASDFPVESVFLADRRAAEMAPLAPPGVPVYVAPQAVMAGVR